MFFFRKRTSQSHIPPHSESQTFILEPILTPSGLVDSPGDDTPDLDLISDSDIPDLDDTPPETDVLDPFLDDFEEIPFSTDEPITPQFESGYFTVGDSGKVGIDFLYDGGGYKGQLAIFSLEGMEDLDPNSEEFIREAAKRASSNSTDGYIIIDDATEGAKFSGKTAWEGNFNAGEYKEVKDFDMNPGDTFGIMLVPNGTVEQVAQNPNIEGSIRPLFSLSTANPSDAFHVGQIADVTGDGNTFVMEDLRVDGWTDKDYNDIIFQVRGATGEAVDLDTVINSDRDWRSSDMGQALIEYAKGYVEEGNTTVIDVDAPSDKQPLIGIIDTGFSNENPDIDYDNITAGSDLIDGDDPFVNTGEDSKHGTHVLGIIGATQDNDMGIDGINDDAPIWISRAVGSGKWAESLVEFVDAARESGQPNAVVNLSMDLTQIDAEGNVSTRYEFTPLEMAALEYARHNDVLVAVAAGNDGAVMSALGQASEQFDNIITVGAADGLERADYSSYGQGLDIMAQGGTPDNPIISTVGDDVEGMYGTSVATAQVTGAISQIWAANPELSYQQIIEILKQTATDMQAPGVDAETGAGLLNMAAAVHLATTIQKEEYEKELQPPNLSWSGEGTYKPIERAANGTATGSGSGSSSLSWGSFLGLFGNYTSPSWNKFLLNIYNLLFSPTLTQTFDVPDGRYIYNASGNSNYKFSLENKTHFQFALTNTALIPNDFTLKLYKDFGNGTLQEVSPERHDTGNHISMRNVDPGNYVAKLELNGNQFSVPYQAIVNLDQAGNKLEQTDDKGLKSRDLGSIGGQRLTLNDFVGSSPFGDKDTYKFKTDANYTSLQFAVRNENGQPVALDGDVKVVLYKGFDPIQTIESVDPSEVYSVNLQPGSPYYVRVEAKSGQKTNYQLVLNLETLRVPPGRHTYTKQGKTNYRFGIGLEHFANTDTGRLQLALTNTNLQPDDYTIELKRDGDPNAISANVTNGNYFAFNNLKKGAYSAEVEITNSAKASEKYDIVFNLDEAGSLLSQTRNLGQIGGKRITVNDYVFANPNIPVDDRERDAYTFSTDSVGRILQFAVRNENGEANAKLDGDVKIVLYDNQDIVLKTVQSTNQDPNSTYAFHNLAPNSTYKVRVEAKSGDATNYQLVLNLEKEVVSVGGETPLLTRQTYQYFQNRPQFYGTEGNYFAQTGYGSSVLGTNSWGQEGNCTWYAYGRLKELGFNPDDILLPPGNRNAGQWGGVLKNGARILGANETPQIGDVAQYTGSPGHVAIVEKVENGRVYLSESHWSTDRDGIDSDGDGKFAGDGTFHRIVNYSIGNPSRYIRLAK